MRLFLRAGIFRVGHMLPLASTQIQLLGTPLWTSLSSS
jgi:hypothetical protein